MNSHKLLAYALPIRILAGIAFIAHGLPKFENVAGTQGFFGSIGLPPELAIPISQSVRSYWWNFSACWCSNKNNCSTFYYRYDWSYASCQDIKRLCRRI
jgi:DoxX